MPLDGLTLSHIARELSSKLTGGRIDRIVQPERDELLLTIRNGGENHILLLSSSAGCARAQLTHFKKSSPLEPFNLCMLMRKHLIGGRILSIRQLESDRILEISVEHLDELGDKAVKRIICEFMGKHSNIIFVAADGRIIDSARRVTEAISSVREVLPGLLYELPPAHNKLPFDAVTSNGLFDALCGKGGQYQKLLCQCVSGMSAQTAREIALRVCGNSEAHADEYDLRAFCTGAADIYDEFLHVSRPTVVYRDAKPTDFFAYPHKTESGLESRDFGSISEAMDEFYHARDMAERIAQKSASLHRTLKTNIERLEKKLALQREALLGSERMEEYRICGELLNANLYAVKKGAKSVTLPNYFDPDMKPIDIPLDVKLSPPQNAQRYFKLYQKARGARTLAAEQIKKTSEELDYLEGQMDNLDKCEGESELSELREELERYGYVRRNTNRRTIKQLPPSAPLRLMAPSGRTILIGRNNLQNDKLTFSAEPNEIWLHVKDAPGSHVIIVGEDPDDETIVYAARLAAAYSKNGSSSKVAVDYTKRRFVKKPSGARPGFVIYTNQHTLYVEPAQR